MITLLKKAVAGFLRDDAIMMSASLAFYAALSLAPLLIILVTAAGYFLGDAREQLLAQAALLAGSRTRTVVEIILDNVGERQFTGSLSTAVTGAIVLFSSTAVFVHLRKSMNRIWGVEAESRRGLLYGLIRGRLLSIAMVAFIGGVLAISFFASATMNLLIPETHTLWRYVNHISSFFIFVLLFATVFRYLPDIRMRWRDVFGGALVTAFLFELGKRGISLYLGTSGIGSVYGAMGSLIVMLIWIYYSSVIFFFGVELTHAYTCTYGAGAVPTHHARFARDDGCRRDPRRGGTS